MTRKYGQFGMSLQYVNGEESMCIWPLRERLGGGAMVIGLSAAYLYADSKTGGPVSRGVRKADLRPTEYGVERCIGGLLAMGIEPTKSDVTKLIDVILNYLPDLIKMKPEPEDRSRIPQAEVDIKHGHMKVVLH